jgi:hypothetical protein
MHDALRSQVRRRWRTHTGQVDAYRVRTEAGVSACRGESLRVLLMANAHLTRRSQNYTFITNLIQIGRGKRSAFARSAISNAGPMVRPAGHRGPVLQGLAERTRSAADADVTECVVGLDRDTQEPPVLPLHDRHLDRVVVPQVTGELVGADTAGQGPWLRSSHSSSHDATANDLTE